MPGYGKMDWITSQYVITTTMVLAISYILDVPIRIWLIALFGGLLLQLFLLGWSSVHINKMKLAERRRNAFRTRFRAFPFTERDNWSKEHMILQQGKRSQTDEQIYPDNFPINDTLNNIVLLIIHDFIKGWFAHISHNDDTFPTLIRQQFTLILRRLIKRLQQIDFSNLFIQDLIPMLNDHLQRYKKATELARNRKSSFESTTLKGKAELDRAIAFDYSHGHLHPALSISSKNPERDIRLYLVKRVERILPYLVDKQELESGPVAIILREIVSNCVFFPLVRMVSDPDFYNQLIMKKLSTIIKDRDDVKRFRSVLNQHSMYDQDTVLENKDSTPSEFHNVKLTMETSEKGFKKVVNWITRCGSIDTLSKYKYLLTLQLNELAKMMDIGDLSIGDNNDLEIYSKRLQILLAGVDTRISSLKRVGNSKTRNLRQVSSKFDPSTIPQDFKITCSDTINDTSMLPFLIEYMEESGEGELIHYYLSVKSLRNPLEDLYNDGMNDEESDTSNIYLSNDMPQSDDIHQIFNQYFKKDTKIKINSACYTKVSDFVHSEHPTLKQYQNARHALFHVQEDALNQIKEDYFSRFLRSECFLRMLAVRNRPGMETEKQPDVEEDNSGNEINGDPLAQYNEEGSDTVEDEHVGGEVIKAVEDALNEITKDNDGSKTHESNASGASSTTQSDSVNSLMKKGSPKDLQKSVFGSSDDDESHSLFDSDSEASFPEKGGLPLFASESNHDDSEMVDDSDVSTPESENVDVHIAAPGDLDLGDEIKNIDSNIQRLKRQLLIIDSLLRKAELTSNEAELNILSKSKTSLEREVQLKTLQKQQYSVQQSESSLYNRSKIRIQSYLTSKDDKRTFILYIIEVQRFSKDNPNVPVAGWMVARRFSQFYRLHQYLKHAYPEVENVSFPKRKVVMKFQEQALIEERKRKLQAYLRKLVGIKSVCSDRMFRDFLSSDEFSNHSNDHGAKPSNVIGGATALYNRIWSQLIYFKKANPEPEESPGMSPSDQISPISSSSALPEGLSSDENMSDDEASEDEINPENYPFVKPLCDMMVTIFQLDKSKTWIGSRALIVVIQQLFDSTFEKMIRTNINGRLRNESNVSELLIALQNTLWPDGKFRKSSIARTNRQKTRSRHKARYILVSFMLDTFTSFFGRTSSKNAAELVVNVLQNDTLNAHIVLTLFDEILDVIFPEVSSN